MRTLPGLLLSLLAGLAAVPQASASSISYSILDILTPTNVGLIPDTGQTFSGTGFVGMYNNNNFGHVFGLENGFSRTNLQVGIGALGGVTVNSATLSFVLRENNGTGGSLTISSYDANGQLGYLFNPLAAAYGTATGGFVDGPDAPQSYDVTGLLQSAVSAGEDWLGLLLFNSGNDRYTFAGSGFSTDRAVVRLTVDYSVAEPATIALVGLPLMVMGLGRRRNARRA